MFDKVCNKKWSLTSILGDYIAKSMIKRDLSQKKVNYGKKFARDFSFGGPEDFEPY